MKARLSERGVAVVELTSSFRAVPPLQRLVNAAFSPHMIEDRTTLQSGYVPLTPYRQARSGQPGVVALPALPLAPRLGASRGRPACFRASCMAALRGMPVR